MKLYQINFEGLFQDQPLCLCEWTDNFGILKANEAAITTI